MKYKKIIVLGGSGAGKSTLANRIGLYTKYPVYHLDNLLLNDDWSRKEKGEWLDICKSEFLSKDAGVVDGQYSHVLEERITWADLIIYIDVPAYIQLSNVVKRLIRVNMGIEKRHGTSKDKKEKFNIEFYRWILFWNKGHRKEMLVKLESITNKKVLITNCQRKLNIEKLLN